MALANRRPVGFPIDSTPSSPSFHPKTLGLGTDYPISSGLKISASSNNNNNNNSSSSLLKSAGTPEIEIKPLTPEKSLSPIDLSPTQLDEHKVGSPALSDININISSNSTNQKTISPSFTTNSLPSTLGASASSNTSVATIISVPGSVTSSAKKKVINRAPTATGISTTIPVTGERPKPEQHPSLDDDVLFAIFEILYEEDATGSGMTVKQVCDVLLSKHPDMAKLSTKTSNLVSAKLNAYVKRVEKGERSLLYALSRDWADASPKRMVYVYRGILTNDYYMHVKAVMDTQKSPESDGALEIASQEEMNEPDNFSAMAKQRRSTMFDLGVKRSTFLETSLDLKAPQLFVPYSTAPVTASLGAGTLEEKKDNDSDYELDDYDPENGQVDDEDDEDRDEDQEEDFFKLSLKKDNKRSKSMSCLPSAKRPKTLTAAAAAPRAPKTPCSPSPNAAAAAAALHAAALQALSPASSISSTSSSSSFSDASSVSSLTSEHPLSKKWLDVVRSGFLIQDIGTPEDISLAELDSLLT